MKEQEAETKKQKRSSDPKVKEKETESKRQRRVDSNNFEKELASKRKCGADMKELLTLFNNSVADGPVYVCTISQQTWFKHSVIQVSELKLRRNDERAMFERCRTHFISEDEKEWICKTCRTAVGDAKIPKLSIYNKNGIS